MASFLFLSPYFPKTSLLRSPLFLLLCAILAGCQSARLPASPSLPPPQVQMVHAESTVSAAPSPAAAPTVTPLPSSTPISPVQALAIQTYGERLIQRIRIPAIGVDSPVVAVGWHAEADAPAEWDSPGPAVGWVLTSALPDQNSNIILYGHNNMYGSVFKSLGRLKKGDLLFLQTGQRLWTYQVVQVLLLPILAADEETRQAYGAYLEPTSSARLTVISCWPPESNTHRLLVIAEPFASHK